jgi:hypothetical protein
VRGGHYRGPVSTAISASYCSTTKDWNRNILKQREEKDETEVAKGVSIRASKATIKEEERGLLQITSKNAPSRE